MSRAIVRGRHLACVFDFLQFDQFFKDVSSFIVEGLKPCNLRIDFFCTVIISGQ